MLRRKPLLLSLATIAGTALLVVLLWPGAKTPVQAQTNPAQQPPAMVETTLAQQRESASTAWVPASVVSRNDARLAGEVPGPLVFVAEVGSKVAAGQPVARVDDETLKLELRDAEALVGRQRAELEQASRQFERLQALKDNKLVAVSQLDEAESAVEIRRRELAQAEVARDRARHRLDRGTVRAPFGGVVVERLAQVGEYLQAGAPVVRFVQTDNVELTARAPAVLATHLETGQTVSIRQQGLAYEGRIRAIVPAADAISRQLELRLELDDCDWLVGSAAEVALPQTASHLAVTVPRDALILRPEGTYVFRVRDDGTAERVSVVAGEVVDDWVEVNGDIVAGDRLIVRGGERLRDGQNVAVRNEATALEAPALASVNTGMKRG
jgi:RND family efflux transporter MFP subunit